ncbi:hypothetical protein Hdeb2414_s0010g00345041 [Helianthus debilis subsp. tardiflorus]
MVKSLLQHIRHRCWLPFYVVPGSDGCKACLVDDDNDDDEIFLRYCFRVPFTNVPANVGCNPCSVDDDEIAR